MQRKRSSKKKVQLNVTIPPALYDWVLEYVDNASELVGRLLEEYKNKGGLTMRIPTERIEYKPISTQTANLMERNGQRR